MKKIMVLFSFFLLFNLFHFESAQALSCATPPSPEAAVHKYDIVIIAKVTDIQEGKDRKIVNAQVSKGIKGFGGNEIKFKEDLMWGESREGAEYLLFLNEVKGYGYESPLCSPTKLASGVDIEALLAAVENEKKSEAEGEQIFTTMETKEENVLKETKDSGKEAPTKTKEKDPETKEEKEFNWMLLLGVGTVLITAGVVTVILVQTRKKRD